MQCGFSGGEPLLSDDLEVLVAEAHKLGFYTNLLTSGVGLTEARARALKDAGLAHIQLSFQDSTRELNDFLSHTRTFELKQKVAAIIKDNGWPMVMNCVIHRLNIDYIDRIIDMAVELGAEYLELANSQYYSWAMLNRDQLLPSREQIERAERVTNERRQRYGDRIRTSSSCPITTRPAEEVHERLGQRLPHRHPRRHRLALPHRAHAARAGLPQRARHGRAQHLVRVGRLQPLPRRRLDEGALPQLPGEGEGPRRLPLPGVHAHR